MITLKISLQETVDEAVQAVKLVVVEEEVDDLVGGRRFLIFGIQIFGILF